jgi:hypothetical protein
MGLGRHIAPQSMDHEGWCWCNCSQGTYSGLVQSTKGPRCARASPKWVYRGPWTPCAPGANMKKSTVFFTWPPLRPPAAAVALPSAVNRYGYMCETTWGSCLAAALHGFAWAHEVQIHRGLHKFRWEIWGTTSSERFTNSTLVCRPGY